MQVEIAPLADLPDGRGIRVDVGDERIALFRIDRAVHAIGDRCSHAEASLAEGDVFDGEVECPRHGSPFDLVTGEPGALPATTSVPVFPAAVKDGIVYLTVGEES
ncbi:MAG: non-heme iron oxygenase ferredoxin subunit [Actinomycetota bacterium]